MKLQGVMKKYRDSMMAQILSEPHVGMGQDIMNGRMNIWLHSFCWREDWNPEATGQCTHRPLLLMNERHNPIQVQSAGTRTSKNINASCTWLEAAWKLEPIPWRQGTIFTTRWKFLAKILVEIQNKVGRFFHLFQGSFSLERPYKRPYLRLPAYPLVHHETSSWRGDYGAASGLHRRNGEVALVGQVDPQKWLWLKIRVGRDPLFFLLLKHQNHSAVHFFGIQLFDYFERQPWMGWTRNEWNLSKVASWFHFFLAIHEQMRCWEPQGLWSLRGWL